MIRINCTLYEFQRENMRTGIFNMEDIHEMILWNLTCVFLVSMTTVFRVPHKVTLYEFLRKNMRAGISNMKVIQEMMFWNLTCMFGVPMTTMLIQITSFFKCGKSFKVESFWQKLDHNYMKAYSQFRWGNYIIIQAPASSDFYWGPESCRSIDFIGQNQKFSKNQHRKINIPSSFVFQIEASKVRIQRKK